MSHLGVDQQSKRSGNERKKWGLGVWIFVILLGLALLFLVWPTFDVVAPHAVQMKATSNCRQIIIAMKAYAADHNGSYPTGKTANEVFRELIREGIFQDERVFGCPFSRFNPDNEVGPPPHFEKAVAGGENHWMMMGGLKDDSLAIVPLVFENALEASWPLVWDGTSRENEEIRKRGQTWNGAKIVVGTNDGSVVVERLGGDDLRRKSFRVWADGRSILDLVPKAVVLDIEE